MQQTSELYQQLLSEEHYVETRLAIGDRGVLVDENGNRLTFGGDGIWINGGGAEDGYTEEEIWTLKTSANVFGSNKPVIGACIAGEIDVRMFKPEATLPKMARLIPYVRLVSIDGLQHSEWVQKGVYFIDTRSYEAFDDSTSIMNIHGFDAMLKAEQSYTGTGNAERDVDVVKKIAEKYLNTNVDEDTEQALNRGYEIQYSTVYTCREILGYIAGSYSGNFIIDDLGNLKLIKLNGLPKQTSVLIDNWGYTLTFGKDAATGEDVRIIV